MTLDQALAIVVNEFPQALIRVAEVLERNRDKDGSETGWAVMPLWDIREHALAHAKATVTHLEAMEGPGKDFDPDHAATRCLMLVQALYGHT